MRAWFVKDENSSYIYSRHWTEAAALRRAEESNACSERAGRSNRVEVVDGDLPDKALHGITLAEVEQLCTAIEAGAVTVTPTKEPDSIYAGNVHYITSNGWQIVVFNDCASFDYVDSVIAPDGREAEAFHQVLVWGGGGEHDYWPPDTVAMWLKAYGPPDGQEQTVWRINLPRGA